MTFQGTRWAAIGAAVAVTLGGGGIAMVSATSPTDAVAFVPITPCRVMDTRPESQVGPRSAPLGPNETFAVKATGATSASGDCSSIPASARAVAMNVTAVGATAPTFLTIWDGSNPRPTSSSLNPTPGQPPTPNAVTTDLDAGGDFSLYNLAGNVHVLADIVGYYADHNHDDRYYTRQQTNKRLPFAVGAELVGQVLLTPALQQVIFVDVTAPVDGQVSVQSSALVYHTVSGGDVACFILRATDPSPTIAVSSPGIQGFEGDGAAIDNGTLAGTRVFDVAAATTTRFQLRCGEAAGDGGRVEARTLTAMFTPAA